MTCRMRVAIASTDAGLQRRRALGAILPDVVNRFAHFPGAQPVRRGRLQHGHQRGFASLQHPIPHDFAAQYDGHAFMHRRDGFVRGGSDNRARAQRLAWLVLRLPILF